MTPIESELLQRLGLAYWRTLEELSIVLSFYGASSLLILYDSSTISIIGAFVLLFSASVVIFMFVLFLFASHLFFLSRTDPEISQPARIFQPRDGSHVHSDPRQLSPLQFEYWESSCRIHCVHTKRSHDHPEH